MLIKAYTALRSCACVDIKSRANILTRVQSKAYTEPSSSVPCLTCRIARTFTTLARRGTWLTPQLSVESYIYTTTYGKWYTTNSLQRFCSKLK